MTHQTVHCSWRPALGLPGRRGGIDRSTTHASAGAWCIALKAGEGPCNLGEHFQPDEAERVNADLAVFWMRRARISISLGDASMSDHDAFEFTELIHPDYALKLTIQERYDTVEGSQSVVLLAMWRTWPRTSLPRDTAASVSNSERSTRLDANTVRHLFEPITTSPSRAARDPWPVIPSGLSTSRPAS